MAPGLPRNISKRADKYNSNIGKKAPVNKDKTERAPVGPVVLGVLLFVVVGSALLQIIQSSGKNSFGGGGE